MKHKVFWVTLILLLINVCTVFAQGEDCGDDPSPDLTCPLDTWVWVLVIGALIFATYHLHQQQKTQGAITAEIN